MRSVAAGLGHAPMLALLIAHFVAGQPGVLRVPLDEAAPFQHTTDTFGDLLHHDLQLRKRSA